MAIVLRITSDSTHKYLDITKSLKALTFGRSESCDYTLDDEGCSGNHLELALKTNQITVKDLDSKNGTILNNKKVTRDRLYVDDIIQIGDSYIELHTDSLTTIEKETFRNRRTIVDQSAGQLTIPDLSRSQRNKEKLVSDDKKRHGFNELTNITGISKPKISELAKAKKKKAE